MLKKKKKKKKKKKTIESQTLFLKICLMLI